MTLGERFRRIECIVTCARDIPVERTVAEEIEAGCAPGVRILAGHEGFPGRNALLLGVPPPGHPEAPRIDRGEHGWMYLRSDEKGNLFLFTDDPCRLYFFHAMVARDLLDADESGFRQGRMFHPAFALQRPVYDLFLNQHARTAAGFKPESYFPLLARLGFTHAEVNGLAFPRPIESGPPGEVYHWFYTYCPSLDQFAESPLNAGAVETAYRTANLERLKRHAAMARRYGLRSGLVCFEPRSVPDALLEKYPMLRGARVDHPLRSFRPRYNLSVAHPAVREHYMIMLRNLLREVPHLDYLSIWSNDSGAGFEYTHSLYVGRNGGGYVIREWKDVADIADAAAGNLVGFLALLRDAGRGINPRFRILVRLEPFWHEHEQIWNRLEEGIDVEVSSLLAKGWSLVYRHPEYPEAPEIHQTALFNRFDPRETRPMKELAAKGCRADVLATPGVLWNHEPLTGIPFPILLFEKLTDLKSAGVSNICSLGGAVPVEFAPWNVNQEVLAHFQAGGVENLNETLEVIAQQWIGHVYKSRLVELWKLTDEAVRAFPIPIWIYAAWSVWYRLQVRPIVPDIEAIPEPERAYYEEHMLATAHNKNRIDLRYDVGFDLLDPGRALAAVGHFDREQLPILEQALGMLRALLEEAGLPAGARGCFADLGDRLRALRCWYRTQRNVSAWVAGVHGYLESKDEKEKSRCRLLLREMVLGEIANTEDLLALWESTGARWMILSEVGETPFIYGKNFGELLKRKIALMRGRENDLPRVDPDFTWRVPGLPAVAQEG